ncbi:50S ribosomal protein L18 [Candidatus Micrarchaeota archaeon]|nr:50S ribosomal protein L18 [Candidatus Micrarchaeota archaeon]MBI5177359.1 50S ribosomal protein L18 [Candidatus Micrarchaeota archaeon]
MTKATGPIFDVHFRRRREGVTDYAKRLRLLKGRLPRLVVRRTGRHVIAQVVEFAGDGDKTVASASSKDIGKLGFAKFSKCNAPSAYLAGRLAARRAVKKGVKKAVLDLGRQDATKGSILFAAAKGANDGGVEVPLDDSVVPSKDRLEGKHLKGADGEFASAVAKIDTS